MERADFIRLARAGAEARLAMLEQERAAIIQLFPDLKPQAGGVGGRRRKSEPVVAAATAADTAVPGARTISVPRTDLSAAARRAISRAQKKRWAAWRKARAAKSR